MPASSEVTEAAWQAQVEQLAKLYRWALYHTRDSRRSEPGFPDLVLVRGPELIFAELKTDKGRPSDPQLTWLDALMDVAGAVHVAAEEAFGDLGPEQQRRRPRVEVYVWRPKDFDFVNERLA